MINITFPDKSVRKYDSSITGHDLAKSISNSLAKNAICIEIDGELRDLSYLIENAACKGLAVGDAVVSNKHANFLINTNNSSAREIEDLGNLIIERVYNKFQIYLEWEIKIIGELN